jgi:hypothetical protein
MGQFNFISLFLFALCFFACSKDSAISPIDPIDPLPGIVRIKTVTEDSVIATSTYDSQGRVREENYSDGWLTVYKYEPGKVIRDNFKTDGTISTTFTYHLNAKGLCTSWDDTRYERTFAYEYDADDHLVHSTTTSFDGTPFQESFYYYENGNRSRDSTVYKQTDDYYTYRYEYFTEIRNTIGDHNYGRTMWGADNQNPYKQIIRKSKGQPATYYNYSIPVLNSDSLIIQRSYVINNGPLNTKSFTYYNK